MFTSNSRFIFQSFDFDRETKTAHFLYTIEAEERESVNFTETLVFDTPGTHSETAAFQQVLFDLHIALGMSYWKAACSQEIIVQSGSLSAEDTVFWNTVYTKGLGEFFYQNRIDFHDLVQFPVSQLAGNQFIEANKEARAEVSKSVLVPLGGGKDSLTTVGLLERSQIPFETVSLGSYALIERQVSLLENPHHRVSRTIDAQLFELNRNGAFNGHIPISVIYAFSSLAIALLNGHGAVLLSNERSANYGNVQYLGEEINHQWSKSLEFEELLTTHLHEHQVAVIYCSVLRPLYEFQITKLFARDIKRWAGLFSSCNRNFVQTTSLHAQASLAKTDDRAYWCGVCPKCMFVGTLLAVHLPEQQLIDVMGSNPLNNPVNEEVFLELLGMSAFKPFECVGTPNEMIIALEKVIVQPGYVNAVLVQKYNNIHAQLDVETALQDARAFGDAHNIPKQLMPLIDHMKQSIL